MQRNSFSTEAEPRGTRSQSNVVMRKVIDLFRVDDLLFESRARIESGVSKVIRQS